MIPQGMLGMFCKLAPAKLYVAWAASDDDAERVFGEYGIDGELVFVNSAIADILARGCETVYLTAVPEPERRFTDPVCAG